MLVLIMNQLFGQTVKVLVDSAYFMYMCIMKNNQCNKKGPFVFVVNTAVGLKMPSCGYQVTLK